MLWRQLCLACRHADAPRDGDLQAVAATGSGCLTGLTPTPGMHQQQQQQRFYQTCGAGNHHQHRPALLLTSSVQGWMRGTMGAGAVVTRMAASVAHQTVEYARPALTEKEITEREVAGRVVADREVAEGDRSGGSLYKEGPVGPAGTSGGGADPGLAQLLSSFQAQRDEVLANPSRSAASLQQIAFSWAAATAAAAAAADQLAAELLAAEQIAADLPPPPRPRRSLQTPPSADGGGLSALQAPPELSEDAKAWSSLSQLLQSLQAR